jgi:hypothetical protein
MSFKSSNESNGCVLPVAKHATVQAVAPNPSVDKSRFRYVPKQMFTEAPEPKPAPKPAPKPKQKPKSKPKPIEIATKQYVFNKYVLTEDEYMKFRLISMTNPELLPNRITDVFARTLIQSVMIDEQKQTEYLKSLRLKIITDTKIIPVAICFDASVVSEIKITVMMRMIYEALVNQGLTDIRLILFTTKTGNIEALHKLNHLDKYPRIDPNILTENYDFINGSRHLNNVITVKPLFSDEHKVLDFYETEHLKNGQWISGTRNMVNDDAQIELFKDFIRNTNIAGIMASKDHLMGDKCKLIADMHCWNPYRLRQINNIAMDVMAKAVDEGRMVVQKK